MGSRSFDFSQDVADAICARLADGQSIRTVCRDEDMPCTTTVFKWLRTMPDFAEQYARAKDEAADAMVEDMLDIADDTASDFVEGEDGKKRVDAEHINRSRLRVDTRKWIASKLKPKKYGDRQQVDMTVRDDRDDDELVHEAREMAKRLGIDPATIPVLAGKR